MTTKRLFCLLAAALLLTACASSAVSTASSGTASSVPESTSQTVETAAVTFTDDLGREVTVSSPKRVAVLLGSYADVWSLAGGKDTIVAAADDALPEILRWMEQLRPLMFQTLSDEPSRARAYAALLDAALKKGCPLNDAETKKILHP